MIGQLKSDLSSAVYNTAAFRILCIDDSVMQLNIYLKYLTQAGCIIETAKNCREGLEIISINTPDLVLLDIDMPEVSGITMLETIKADDSLRSIPVIMISSLDDADTIKTCFELGAIDYIRKPFYRDEFLMRIKLQLENLMLKREQEKSKFSLEKMVDEKVGEIKSVKNSTIFALAKLAESRDPHTGAHLERIQEYVRILSQELAKLSKYKNLIDENFTQDIYNVSTLHDIGKVGIPDDVLLKKGPLDEAETKIMQKHTIIGGDAIDAISRRYQGLNYLSIAKNIAYYHHEKWNGKGYPMGLKGEQIPLESRITTLADIYDALSEKRVYKEAFPEEMVEIIMAKEAEQTFDPDIYEIYIRNRDKFQQIRAKWTREGVYNPRMSSIKNAHTQSNSFHPGTDHAVTDDADSTEAGSRL